ncbi:large ribosomal subunit protein eL6-like isoform X1 [Malus domestica]|uniref:large ribosomal subunit protein eL6-like isoform X1 n=1 Tax=Malus domestica TaxID=3750 RepID=UPI003975EDC5
MAAKARNPRKTRNPDLVRGVGKFSRSKMYHKRGLWAIKAKNGGVFPRHDAKPAAETQPEKPPKFYPADDVKKPLVNKRKPKPTKLRASITPGTVLIILAGRFKGKRVVFLKQLSSGLLLVTGPFKINGVPLRRVNQSYVIATSTKVDISGLNVEKFDDKYFAKEVEKKKKKGEGEFFEAEKELDLFFYMLMASMSVIGELHSLCQSFWWKLFVVSLLINISRTTNCRRRMCSRKERKTIRRVWMLH